MCPRRPLKFSGDVVAGVLTHSERREGNNLTTSLVSVHREVRTEKEGQLGEHKDGVGREIMHSFQSLLWVFSPKDVSNVASRRHERSRGGSTQNTHTQDNDREGLLGMKG